MVRLLSSKGISLIEAMLAVAILAVVGVSLSTLLVNSANLGKHLAAKDEFDAFVNDLRENLKFDDRCTNLLNSALGAAPLTPTAINVTTSTTVDTKKRRKTSVSTSTAGAGVPPRVIFANFEFKGKTYTPANNANNYIYDTGANQSSGVHITEFSIVRPSTPNVETTTVQPVVPGPFITANRYFTTLNVVARKDRGGGVTVPLATATIGVVVLLNPATNRLIKCNADEGIASTCESLGGTYNSKSTLGDRCNLNPVFGGCTPGSQFVIKKASDGTDECDTPNPATGACSCPTGQTLYENQTFKGIDPADGATYNFRVLNCYSCDLTTATPYPPFSLASGGPPTLNLLVVPSLVTTGSQATLTWTSDGTTCTAAGGWSGAIAVSGSQNVSPPTGTTTYELSCSNSHGSTVKSVSVRSVAPNATALPTVQIQALLTTIPDGSSTTLTWGSANADSCTGSGGTWSTITELGSAVVTPAATTTYTFTCTNANGTASANASIIVLP